MKLHNVTQGSPEWLSLRANYFTASEAPAMMGASKYSTREQLLAQKKTGFSPDIDSAKQRIFKAGHDTEAAYRPHAEELIGDELYPCTGSLEVDGLNLLASFDGLTMDRKTGYEHKLYNVSIDDFIDQFGEPGPAYYWQLEQQLLVSGADRILFVTSDGSPEKVAKCWYASKPERRAALIAGWKQFALDLAAFVPTAKAPPIAAEPVEALPALLMTVSGAVTVSDNFKVFEARLRDFLENRLIRTPKTDQDFVDLDVQIKAMKDAREALKEGKSQMFAQVQPIDQAAKTADMLDTLLQQNCAMAERMLKDEKENRRTKILSDAVAALHAHLKGLQERTRNYMPTVPNQFQDVIKGLKSLDSMKDKLAGELARCKIEANAIADKITFNLALLDDNTEFGFLFPDAGQMVLKAADDFTALVNSRIAAHKAEAARKEEETRARIQAEEQAKAEKAAREKLAAEQADIAKAESERIAAEAAKVERIVTAPDVAPALTHTQVVQQMPVTVRQAMAPKAAATPTLALGVISERLGVNVTSAFLAMLGFEATTVRAAKLYQEGDFPAICQALIDHIAEVQEQFESVAV